MTGLIALVSSFMGLVTLQPDPSAVVLWTTNGFLVAWLPVDGSASPASASHLTRWRSRVDQVLRRRPVTAGFERGHP